MRIGDSWVLMTGCLIALMPTVTRAQADRYAPTVLQIAPTPRMSTFGSGTAARDIEAFFANPAMVGAAVGTIARTSGNTLSTAPTCSVSCPATSHSGSRGTTHAASASRSSTCR